MKSCARSSTPPARRRDLNLIVHLATSGEGSNLPLTSKFGVQAHDAPSLLMAARQATQDLMGVSFHVSSASARPTAYTAAMAAASRALVRRQRPSPMSSMSVAATVGLSGWVWLSRNMDVINRAFDEMKVHEETQLTRPSPAVPGRPNRPRS